MITVTWNATGAECTTFRTVGGLAAWLSTTEFCVTDIVGSHPSVDLRNVSIPEEAKVDAWFLVDNGLYKNGRKVAASSPDLYA